MRTRPSIIKNQDGFTLVELIVTIMVAAILGVMFVQVMGTSLTGSVEPLIRTQHMFEINGVMENITRDYNKLMKESAPLTDLQDHVAAGNDDANVPYFGAYTFATSYISFDVNGIEEDPIGNNILKVSIADESGEQRLTALFTK